MSVSCRSRRSSLRGRAALVAAALSVSLPASAEVTKIQCIAANTQAQNLRRENKLALTREQLHLCVDAKCPGVVRNDCTKLLEELEIAQPTIVFEAKNGAGADVSAVKVAIDGRPFAERLDGSAMLVDPGDHTFTFEAAGETSVTAHYVIREGEKGRRERVVIGAPPPVVAIKAPPPAAPLPLPPPRDGMATLKVAGIATGAIGVAGIVVGGVFGGLTAAAIHEQTTDCGGATRSACPNYSGAAAAHSTANTDGAISTVAFVAGGAFVAAGVVMYLWPSPGSHENRGTTSLVVLPSVGAGAGGLSLQGRF